MAKWHLGVMRAGRGDRSSALLTPALLCCLGCARDTTGISLLALPGIPQAGGGSEKWESNIPAQVSGQVSAFILPRPDTWNQQLSVPKCISEWEIQKDMKEDGEKVPLCPWEHMFSVGPSQSPSSKCSGQKLILSCTLGTDLGTRASREVAFTWETDFPLKKKKKKP